MSLYIRIFSCWPDNIRHLELFLHQLFLRDSEQIEAATGAEEAFLSNDDLGVSLSHGTSTPLSELHMCHALGCQYYCSQAYKHIYTHMYICIAYKNAYKVHSFILCSRKHFTFL